MHSVAAVAVAETNPLRRGRDSGFFLRSDLPADPAPASAVTVASKPEDRSDEELIAALIADAPWGWKEFQRRFDRLIHRCITKVTRRFSALVGPDDVRDIYSTLYLSLLTNDRHKLRTFDPTRGNRFSSWIGLLAINCAYDYLRSIKREPRKECLAEAVELACQLPDPYETAVDSQRAEIAARILEDLSEKDQTFAALYFSEQLDPVEIASRMNISVKTVYSKKHKIQSRLESVLAGTGEAAA